MFFDSAYTQSKHSYIYFFLLITITINITTYTSCICTSEIGEDKMISSAVG